MSANTTFQVINEQGWRRGFANLLRLVLEDQALTVTEFGRKKHNLEEVFMSIVGEEQHVG